MEIASLAPTRSSSGMRDSVACAGGRRGGDAEQLGYVRFEGWIA